MCFYASHILYKCIIVHNVFGRRLVHFNMLSLSSSSSCTFKYWHLWFFFAPNKVRNVENVSNYFVDALLQSTEQQPLSTQPKPEANQSKNTHVYYTAKKIANINNIHDANPRHKGCTEHAIRNHSHPLRAEG